MSPSNFDEDGAAILARRQYFIALALGSLATGCASRAVGAEGNESSDTDAMSSSSTTGGSTTGDEGTSGPSGGTEAGGDPTIMGESASCACSSPREEVPLGAALGLLVLGLIAPRRQRRG